MRRFWLQRDHDVTGTSGVGIVAEGVVLSSGAAVLSWLTEFSSIAIYPSIEILEKIHGHDGSTRVVWQDGE
jgi:hypothetical protein